MGVVELVRSVERGDGRCKFRSPALRPIPEGQRVNYLLETRAFCELSYCVGVAGQECLRDGLPKEESARESGTSEPEAQRGEPKRDVVVDNMKHPVLGKPPSDQIAPDVAVLSAEEHVVSHIDELNSGATLREWAPTSFTNCFNSRGRGSRLLDGSATPHWSAVTANNGVQLVGGIVGQGLPEQTPEISTPVGK